MIKTQYTTADLKKLPLRAIVAFAARCARRVAPMPNSPRATRSERPVEWPSTTPSGSPRRSPEAQPAPPNEPVVQALDATQAISGEGIGSECAAAAAAAAARTAATVWLVLNREKTIKTPDRWTNTPEARSFRTRLANHMADLVALDACTAAVEAAEAVAHDDHLHARRRP